MRITDFLNELAIRDAGWVKHEGPQGTAFFPETIDPKDNDAVAVWERRCLSLHSAQETLISEPKPLENLFARGD